MNATCESGISELRMSVRKKAGKVAPALAGKYSKFILEAGGASAMASSAPLDSSLSAAETRSFDNRSFDAVAEMEAFEWPSPHSLGGLQSPAVDFPVPDPAPEANDSNDSEPVLLMHMPKRPAGWSWFTAASEITPEDPLEEVTGLVEHLSLTEADAPSPGPTDQVTGLNFSLPGDFSFAHLAAVSRPFRPRKRIQTVHA